MNEANAAPVKSELIAEGMLEACARQHD